MDESTWDSAPRIPAFQLLPPDITIPTPSETLFNFLSSKVKAKCAPDLVAVASPVRAASRPQPRRAIEDLRHPWKDQWTSKP